MRRISPVCELALLTSFLWVTASGQLGTKDSPHQPGATHSSVSALIAKLTASDGGKNNELGYSVSASGDTIVVGAPYATVAGRYAQGAVYVFERSAKGWTEVRQTAKLTASNGEVNAFFGSSVSISDNTIVVGADGANVHAEMSQGAAYVFAQNGAAWSQQAELLGPVGKKLPSAEAAVIERKLREEDDAASSGMGLFFTE